MTSSRLTSGEKRPLGAVLGTLTCYCGGAGSTPPLVANAAAPRPSVRRTRQRADSPCAPGARSAVQSTVSRRPADAQFFRPGSLMPERARPSAHARGGGALLPREAGLRRGRDFNGSQWAERRRQWHPTPILLPGKSHGWRSLVGCSPWGRTESDTTEAT